MRRLRDDVILDRARLAIETASRLIELSESKEDRAKALALLEPIVRSCDADVRSARRAFKRWINWSEIRRFYRMVTRSGYPAAAHSDSENVEIKKIKTWMSGWKDDLELLGTAPQQEDIDDFVARFPSAAFVADMLDFEWDVKQVDAFLGRGSTRSRRAPSDWLIERISDRLRAAGNKGIGTRTIRGKLGTMKSH